MKYTFGLSCDEEVHRLIQCIPSGQRSEMIRNAIIAYTPNIESMLEEHFKMVLEQNIRQRKMEEERQRRQEKEQEYLMQKRIHRSRSIAKETAFHVQNWLSTLSNAKIDTLP